jgi:hypothetical protein
MKQAKTHANLKAAFAGESRLTPGICVPDIEGYPDTAHLFRDTAECENRLRPRAHGFSQEGRRSRLGLAVRRVTCSRGLDMQVELACDRGFCQQP